MKNLVHYFFGPCAVDRGTYGGLPRDLKCLITGDVVSKDLEVTCLACKEYGIAHGFTALVVGPIRGRFASDYPKP
jgi:hypothetical protein